jgi:hypothetical protein
VEALIELGMAGDQDLNRDQETLPLDFDLIEDLVPSLKRCCSHEGYGSSDVRQERPSQFRCH